MTKVFNQTSQKIKRRLLRKRLPPAEVRMWLQLKRKQLAGYKFRRQYSVGKYVVDFYCPQIKLAIEIDGYSHDANEENRLYDKRRQKYIESFGIHFLRFTNQEIHHNLTGVLKKIEMVCDELDREGGGKDLNDLQPPLTPPW